MKKLLIVLLIGLAACSSSEDRQKTARKEMLSTDRAFSAMSGEKGMQEAFLHYGADDLVKLQEGQFPVIGKEALRRVFAEVPDNMHL